MPDLRVPKKPADILRDVAAPREIIEWVRKLPPAEAARTAWIDCPKADWLPYIAILRGFDQQAIVRTTCACIVDLLGPTQDPTQQRLLDVLRAGAEGGKAALAPAEAALDDLRLAMIQHGTAPSPPAWTPTAKLVLELARCAGRGNQLVGVALAMRMLVEQRGRKANTDLIARFRDKLTIGA